MELEEFLAGFFAIGMPLICLAGYAIHGERLRFAWYSLGIFSSLLPFFAAWGGWFFPGVLFGLYGCGIIALWVYIIRSFDPNPGLTALDREFRAKRKSAP